MQNVILICMNVSAAEPSSPRVKVLTNQLLPIFHTGFGFCHLGKEVDAFGQT